MMLVYIQQQMQIGNIMETTYAQMFGKKNDYKQCRECFRPNWYDNEYCIECGNTTFATRGMGIHSWIEQDYKYYMQEENYTEEEVDNIVIDI